MAKKKARAKAAAPADKANPPGTTLVRVYLPTAIRNRLRMHAIRNGQNMAQAAAAVLDKNLPEYEE